MNQQMDFNYQISDERLMSFSAIPVLDRLKWLDDIRIFTLMVRGAPDVVLAASPAPHGEKQ